MKKYFEWLKSQVDFLDFPEKYDRLFHALDNTVFRYKIYNDKNRVADAIQLRNLYHETTNRNAPSRSNPATVFEVLISISRRMNYICASFDEDKTKIIFRRLMANLDLARMSDPFYDREGGDGRVEIILTNWMDRRYEPDGRGGVFPMAAPRENQREVEIWYQMNQYLSDPNGEDLKSY